MTPSFVRRMWSRRRFRSDRRGAEAAAPELAHSVHASLDFVALSVAVRQLPLVAAAGVPRLKTVTTQPRCWRTDLTSRSKVDSRVRAHQMPSAASGRHSWRCSSGL